MFQGFNCTNYISSENATHLLTKKQLHQLLKLLKIDNNTENLNYSQLKQLLYKKIPDYSGKSDFQEIYNYIIDTFPWIFGSNSNSEKYKDRIIETTEDPIYIFHNFSHETSILDQFPVARLNPHAFPTNVFIASFFKDIFYSIQPNFKDFFTNNCFFSINSMEYPSKRESPVSVFQDFFFDPYHHNNIKISGFVIAEFFAELFPEGFLSRPMEVLNQILIKPYFYSVIVRGVFYKLVPFKCVFGFDMSLIIKYSANSEHGFEIQNMHFFIREGPKINQ